MKLIYLILQIGLFLSGVITPLYKNYGQSSQEMQIAAEEELIKRGLQQRQTNFLNLELAKFSLISGATTKAIFYTNRINDLETVLVPIKKRYQSLAYFLEGELEKSYELLLGKELNQDHHFREYCVHKLTLRLKLKKLDGIDYDFIRCKNLTSKFSVNDQLFLETLYLLAMKKDEKVKEMLTYGINEFFATDQLLELWLKVGLYLHYEEILEANISKIPEESYMSKKIRELISLVYYKRGNLRLAAKFIDDLYTPNAENLKVNIFLKGKKYELALGHINLALTKKKNSINALERGIPLSIKLDRWDNGLSMLSRITPSILDDKDKLTLMSYFQTRKGQYDEAIKILKNVFLLYNEKLPLELYPQYAYVSLITGDEATAKLYFTKACSNFDGISCYMMAQLNIWDSISKTIQRDESITSSGGELIHDLLNNEEVSPIDELKMIDQKDIEELDANQFDMQKLDNKSKTSEF